MAAALSLHESVPGPGPERRDPLDAVVVEPGLGCREGDGRQDEEDGEPDGSEAYEGSLGWLPGRHPKTRASARVARRVLRSGHRSTGAR
jgi:hypothetical protein